MTVDPPIGVLLVQLGTPDAPTPAALRRYLGEFLTDRRVVDVSPWLWRPLLHGVILRTRPRRSAALYRRIWTDDGSPLLHFSRRQRDGLRERLGDGFRVELGMRYGNPPAAAALDRLADAGCRRVVVLPMFPQFCSATTGSVFDAVAAWAKGRPALPSFSFVRGFADHPTYIAALAATVRDAGVAPTSEAPLLVSFHGIPQKLADRGDPYPGECEATARALAAALDLGEADWRVVYQSRFGPAAWLQPYFDETLRALPGEGVRTVAVATPSFVVDCLETIDEIGREGKLIFEEAGGDGYVRVPCPNDRSDVIDALATIVREHVPSGWGA
ncbi:MAG: ferrochelatase [Planctomycetota bacterium]|jgi:ferrochelatase